MTDRWLYSWAVASVAAGAASLLVPLTLVRLGGSAFDLGLLASSAAFVGAPGAVVFGRIADKTGRRRPLVLGALAVMTGALAVLPTVELIPLVIGLNAVFWLAVGALAPVLTMLVVDAVPESEWETQIGRLNTFQGYGWAVGLVLGMLWTGVLGRVTTAGFAQQSLLALCAVVVAAATLSAVRTLPPDGATAHVATGQRSRRIARLLSQSRRNVRGATFPFTPNRLYWATRSLRPSALRQRFSRQLGLYFLAATLFFTGFAAFWAPLPLYLERLGYDSGLIFGLYLVSGLASAGLYGRVGPLLDRVEPHWLQSGAVAVRGLVIVAVGSVGALGSTLALGGIAVALGAIGATWAVVAVVGTSMVTRFTPARLRGEVLGTYTALGAVAGGLGSVAGGAVAAVDFRLAFAVAGAVAVCGAVVVAVVGTGSGESGGATEQFRS